eukprot:CAMPEP_0197026350 /NCGR_PEP_ID=MMETSP1384-20130603/6456_1 /TAXON_ID=29189 /ORGANISM="Ammonia sp." /LENGTH=833 /DNA_ID=CAMNT_0042454995 /DNA_START=28 /DNA_END=2529 /DNA_ORIENTATION=-
MANRRNVAAKKPSATKYSAIGSTVVPLSQQMRSSRSPTSQNQNSTSTSDNFFDDIMADWATPSQPADANKKTRNTISDGLGIHKENDVSSSSPSLSFTPTPPPKKTKPIQPTGPMDDRSVFYLDNGKQPKPQSKRSSTSLAESQSSKPKHSETPNSTNFTQSIFDDLMPSLPANGTDAAPPALQEKSIEDLHTTIHNDPNYLPPPEEQSKNKAHALQASQSNASSASTALSLSEHSQHSEDEEGEEDEQDGVTSPGKNELNPWAHLNKVSITEAPIDDDDEHENRGFLRHDGVDDGAGFSYSPKNNQTHSASSWKCWNCMIFVVGIVIGILLTVALIRHQAIDADYLLGPTSTETESDSVIETEMEDNLYNIQPYINLPHNASTTQVAPTRRDPLPADDEDDDYDSYEYYDDDEEEEILSNIRGRETPSPTLSPIHSSPTKKRRPRKSTQSPTSTPTKRPTATPTNKRTTKSPTEIPTHSPTQHVYSRHSRQYKTTSSTLTKLPSLSPSATTTTTSTTGIPTHFPPRNARKRHPIKSEIIEKASNESMNTTIITTADSLSSEYSKIQENLSGKNRDQKQSESVINATFSPTNEPTPAPTRLSRQSDTKSKTVSSLKDDINQTLASNASSDESSTSSWREEAHKKYAKYLRHRKNTSSSASPKRSTTTRIPTESAKPRQTTEAPIVNIQNDSHEESAETEQVPRNDSSVDDDVFVIDMNEKEESEEEELEEDADEEESNEANEDIVNDEHEQPVDDDRQSNVNEMSGDQEIDSGTVNADESEKTDVDVVEEETKVKRHRNNQGGDDSSIRSTLPIAATPSADEYEALQTLETNL